MRTLKEWLKEKSPRLGEAFDEIDRMGGIWSYGIYAPVSFHDEAAIIIHLVREKGGKKEEYIIPM